MLPPIADLEFFEDRHTYRYKGRWLPYSVSRIAQPTTEEERAKFDATKHIWGPRGTTVHAVLEGYLTGQNVADRGEYSSWCDAMLGHWLFDGCMVEAVEYRLCDARKGIGGSFDFLLTTSKGTRILGDLKTVGSDSQVKSRKSAKAQLGGYLAMLIDHYPNVTVQKCCTLIVGPTQTRLISEEPNDCLGAWVDAWDAFKLLECPW